MENRQIFIVFNIKKDIKEEGIEELLGELKEHHKSINYHLKIIDKRLGQIDEAINNYDGEIWEDWI